jgi:hypothetical protein
MGSGRWIEPPSHDATSQLHLGAINFTMYGSMSVIAIFRQLRSCLTARPVDWVSIQVSECLFSRCS